VTRALLIRIEEMQINEKCEINPQDQARTCEFQKRGAV